MTSLQNSIDLAGKRALVTGASRGIGAATVKLLAAAGADVVVGYNTRRADAETVAEYARSLGVRSDARGVVGGPGDRPRSSIYRGPMIAVVAVPSFGNEIETGRQATERGRRMLPPGLGGWVSATRG